jgi:hypothetical protein
MNIVPTKKQQEFLSSSDDIVLFGGAEWTPSNL